MSPSIEELVGQIVAINHGWKLAIERWGNQSAISLALRQRKSSLQADLLRLWPDQVWLRVDQEAEGRELFSVRLGREVRLPSGVRRQDAEHMPVDVARELLTPGELQKAVRS